MTRNVGTIDRVLRVTAAIASGLAAALGPLELAPRLALGGTAAYLLWTALAGSCLGYRLMGRSTCSVGQRA